MTTTHPKQEQTLVIIKPDGIQRSLIGTVISRFEQIGLKLVAMKMVVPTAEMIEKHYTLDPEWRSITGQKTIDAFRSRGKTPPFEHAHDMSADILKRLGHYLTSGPVIAMIWQGAHAVKIMRKLVGSTEPFSSDVGTIRGDFMLDSYELSEMEGRSIRNIIHASGSVKEAQDEIAHWFEKGEVFVYDHVQEQIMYKK
jgi:nucleoside-diphosphate kinase